MKTEKPLIEIFAIKPGDPRLDQVEQLYRELYDSEAQLGVSIPLIEGGEKLWRSSLEKMLGRISQVIVAAEGDTVAGFCYGSIRILAPHFGNIKMGYWEAMIIRPSYRKRGLGDKMAELLIDWMKERGCSLLEGERLLVNENAVRNLERLGWKPELIKYRRLLK